MTTRPLFIHVGSCKTATSSLQAGLWRSTTELNEVGIVTPLHGRTPHVFQILRPLGWRAGAGFVAQPDRGTLRELGEVLRRSPGDRLLVSIEDLAEAEPDRIEMLMDVVPSEFDVHVIVSARSWDLQLPAEWQERLKERLTMDYESYLIAVRDRQGAVARRFWLAQDALDISERWGSGLHPSRVHVVVVPPASVDREAVYRLFGGVVGFDPAILHLPEGSVNASFGYTEAELLRQLNITLGERLTNYLDEYRPAIRRPLIQRALVRQASTRIPLPPEHVGWVREAMSARAASIVDHAYSVHGDLALLVPAADVGRPIPAIDGDAMAAAALRTLANFAVVQFEDGSGRRKAKRKRPLGS